MGNRSSLSDALHNRTKATLNAMTISEQPAANETPLQSIAASPNDEHSCKVVRANVDVDQLHSFRTADIGFQPYDEASLKSLAQSIASDGLLNVIQVRPDPDGNGYEILSGHNRWNACKLLGWKTIPVEIYDADNDRATRIAIITNIKQRHYLRPSERALAYRAFADTMKHQGSRTDLLVDLDADDAAKLKPGMTTRDQIAVIYDVDRNSVQRHLRLSYLIHPLLYMIDSKEIPLMTGVNLSYYSEAIQNAVYEAIKDKARPIMTFNMIQQIRKACPANGATVKDFMRTWDLSESGELEQPKYVQTQERADDQIEPSVSAVSASVHAKASDDLSHLKSNTSGEYGATSEAPSEMETVSAPTETEKSAFKPQPEPVSLADTSDEMEDAKGGVEPDVIVYNKLVRNNIPSIIEADGCTCGYRTLNDDEFKTALFAKLKEECEELVANPCLEEFADVYEVLDALRVAQGYSEEEVHDFRMIKAMKRGTFSDRIFLESVKNN